MILKIDSRPIFQKLLVIENCWGSQILSLVLLVEDESDKLFFEKPLSRGWNRFLTVLNFKVVPNT